MDRPKPDRTIPETDENNYLQVYNNTFNGYLVGQSWCKPSVSKHSRIHLSSSFPVCASVDFLQQSSGTIIVHIHIRYTSYMLKRQPSSTVSGKQKVNRFFVKFF